MGIKTLYEGYMSVVNYIYSPKNYYERILNFIKYYKSVNKHPLKLAIFAAFIRSIIYLGILNKGEAKLYYWKALLQAVLFWNEKYFCEILNMQFLLIIFRNKSSL